MLITFIFFIIAAGNTCFGILVHPISKFLGEISYGIYLLHGLVRFVMFKFVFKLNSVDQLSAFGYWGIVYLCLVIVLTLAYFSYTFLEHPAMQQVNKITQVIRSNWLAKLPKRWSWYNRN